MIVWVSIHRLYCSIIDCANTQIPEFLVNNVYLPLFNNGSYDINEKETQERTLLWMVCHKGKHEVVKLLYDKFGSKLNPNIPAATKRFESSYPIMEATIYDSYKCIKYLINHPNAQIRCNINATDDNNETALMKCVDNSSLQCLKLLCKNKETKITQIINKSHEHNVIDKAAFNGEIDAFRILILTLFQRSNVNSWASLVESKIINKHKISRWKNLCQQKKNSDNDAFFGFVSNIENIVKNANFAMLKRTLGGEDDQEVGSGKKAIVTNDNLHNFMKCDKIANYLMQNCKESTRNDLFEVITNGMIKQECGFDDSLLFMAYHHDRNRFRKTMEECVRMCLCDKNTRNAKTSSFFKNNLEHSKIWCLPAMTKIEEKEKVSTTGDEKETEKQIKEKDEYKKSTLFEEIRMSVIEKELHLQKEFLQKEIIKEEKENNENWNSLKYSILPINIGRDDQISQNRLCVDATIPYLRGRELMENGGNKPDYKKTELPFDNVNGYNGIEEYDINGYLTKLLISAHKIDPVFQESCQNIFKFVPNCYYTAAPPKTKKRAQMKALLEYYDSQYPHCGNILDIVRGSVVFDTTKDLLIGFEMFRKIIDSNKKKLGRNDNGAQQQNESKSGCIKHIIRIKNGFNKIEDESWNTNINKFQYCDIKVNMLIEYNNVKLIGELQFLLSFMLTSKKMSHIVYSFVRNETFFNNLNKLAFESKEKVMNKIILNQNAGLLSNLLENCSDIDKEHFLLKQEFYETFLKDSQWTRGTKLFELYLTNWRKDTKC